MLMANNHACPVSQSAARPDTNDLLQGQRSLFLEGKLLTVAAGEGRRGREGRGLVEGRWQEGNFVVGLAVEKERPAQQLRPGTVANRTARGSSGQPPGPFPSQQPPDPHTSSSSLASSGPAKITAQHPPPNTKLHVKRHLLLLFTSAPFGGSLCLFKGHAGEAEWRRGGEEERWRGGGEERRAGWLAGK